MSNRVVKNLDWVSIFERRPDLKPPGYEEAVAATKIATEKRKMTPKGSLLNKSAAKNLERGKANGYVL